MNISSSESLRKNNAILYRQLEEDWPRARSFLERLVQANSHTLNKEGVAENARILEEDFSPLGFHAFRQPSSDPRYGTVTNRVPESASASLEIRYINPSDYSEIKTRLLDKNDAGCFAGPRSTQRCEVILRPEQEIDSWPGGDQTSRLADIWTTKTTPT